MLMQLYVRTLAAWPRGYVHGYFSDMVRNKMNQNASPMKTFMLPQPPARAMLET